MKRITYNGEPLVTGSSVSAALVHYVTHVSTAATAVAVEIPVLEHNGTVRSHTLILSATTQLDVKDVDGVADGEENRFPVPRFPRTSEEAFPLAAADISTLVPILDEDLLTGADRDGTDRVAP
ncbi:hypothetical protein [Cryobacterium soli]|jgi:hypothetical protein|uniref:hypothetical protein n=1 Tax=Cryobacterium soli TaxID=2220095 RepID=UPI000E750640|nr:hypothetical protein [Cryobacterium soli]